jgi:hypothetical protein
MPSVRSLTPKFDHGKTFFSGTPVTSRKYLSRRSGRRNDLFSCIKTKNGERASAFRDVALRRNALLDCKKAADGYRFVRSEDDVTSRALAPACTGVRRSSSTSGEQAVGHFRVKNATITMPGSRYEITAVEAPPITLPLTQRAMITLGGSVTERSHTA